MRWPLALLWCAPLIAADGPHLYYTKSFPGSSPAYVAISLDRHGAGEYKEAEDDDRPMHFQLSEAEAAQIFGLVAKLGYLDHPLESGLKVAFMGAKTFRYEDGGAKHEVKFNYSSDPDARELADCFERITESEDILINLETAAKYDKLGILHAVLLLEGAFGHKRVVAPEQFLPVLDRIVKNESYLHEARLRAAAIADAIRNTK